MKGQGLYLTFNPEPLHVGNVKHILKSHRAVETKFHIEHPWVEKTKKKKICSNQP